VSDADAAEASKHVANGPLRGVVIRHGGRGRACIIAAVASCMYLSSEEGLSRVACAFIPYLASRGLVSWSGDDEPWQEICSLYTPDTPGGWGAAWGLVGLEVLAQSVIAAGRSGDERGSFEHGLEGFSKSMRDWLQRMPQRDDTAEREMGGEAGIRALLCCAFELCCSLMHGQRLSEGPLALALGLLQRAPSLPRSDGEVSNLPDHEGFLLVAFLLTYAP
jgi:hypothetical protein